MCSPSITTTTSPLSSASPMCDSTSEIRPRMTSSWSLVSSRAIAMRRSPNATNASRSRICTRRGDSKTTSVLGSWRRASSRRMRSPGLRGRNPSNAKRSVGRPDSTSAASAADGPGTHPHVDPGFDRAVHQAVAGIGDRGHAAVGDERHRAPRPEAFDQLVGALAFVAFEERDHRLAERQTVEQAAGPAGVLTCDHVDVGQDLARPGREVAQVADRRAHEPQRSLHGSRVTR